MARYFPGSAAPFTYTYFVDNVPTEVTDIRFFWHVGTDQVAEETPTYDPVDKQYSVTVVPQDEGYLHVAWWSDALGLVDEKTVVVERSGFTDADTDTW